MNEPKKLDKTERLWLDRAKTIRAAVRLKYALMADEELRVLLPDERKDFVKSLQNGTIPAPISVDAYLRGKMLPAARP